MQDAKEEVRARLAIEDVIGEYVQLKRAGRNFKGLSPFTSEKTPSFMVSPDKQIWHDFSSGKGGDVFSFVMEVEGMDFRQALEHLARKAGVDMSLYQAAGGQVTKHKARLTAACQLAAEYYQHSLVRNQHALEYARRRGLTRQTIGEFRIGYAPDEGRALVTFLTKKGFTGRELAQAGLTNRFGGDLFRGRLMLPLLDPSGQVVGFTGRALHDEAGPKYLNTPQTLLYDKSRHIFGLSQAKAAIRQADYSVIVEGNMDVVSSHQAGIRPVVATAGTAMTEQHIRALARLSQQVRLAFDGDKAGLAATERAIPLAQATGVELRIVMLPEGAKDPDELIQRDPALWQAAIQAARPVVDWVLDQYSHRHDLTTAAGKRHFTSAALTIIAALSDAVERDHYYRLVANQVGSSLAAIQAKVAALARPAGSTRLRPVAASATAPSDDHHPHQDSLLAVACYDPAVRPLLAPVDPAWCTGPARQELMKFLQQSSQPLTETPDSLRQYDTYVKIVLLQADTRYAAWSDHDRYVEATRLVRHVTSQHNQQQKTTLLDQLRQAEADGDEPRAADLRGRLHRLIKEMTSGR